MTKSHLHDMLRKKKLVSIQTDLIFFLKVQNVLNYVLILVKFDSMLH